MNMLDSQLDRLLRSAARAPQPAAVHELPFAAEARVMAAWRRSQSETPRWIGQWLRAGLAAAAVVTATIMTLSWVSLRPSADDEFAEANAALYVAVAP